MNSDGSSIPVAASGVDPLWDELARDRRDRAAVGPVLRHLVTGDSNELFGEEPVVRTRAMIESLALELLRLDSDSPAPHRIDALIAALTDSAPLLGHVHALALEGQILGRLAEQGVDPLLPPLVQDRIDQGGRDAPRYLMIKANVLSQSGDAAGAAVPVQVPQAGMSE